jgi:hypothetical protein
MVNSLFLNNTQSFVKNQKNDNNDASLQVDPMGDVRRSLSGARPPVREAILPRSLPVMVSEKGASFSGIFLELQKN